MAHGKVDELSASCSLTSFPELLATNPLGEKIIASIAVSDGHLFIRGYQNLWCIWK